MAVRVAQYLSIFIAMIMEEEIPTGKEKLSVHIISIRHTFTNASLCIFPH